MQFHYIAIEGAIGVGKTAVVERLAERFDATTVMEEWGYTGSACIPMALDDAMEKHKIKPGGLLVLVGSGVGYNQAGVALRMP